MVELFSVTQKSGRKIAASVLIRVDNNFTVCSNSNELFQLLPFLSMFAISADILLLFSLAYFNECKDSKVFTIFYQGDMIIQHTVMLDVKIPKQVKDYRQKNSIVSY